jgi:hypothetical protein
MAEAGRLALQTPRGSFRLANESGTLARFNFQSWYRRQDLHLHNLRFELSASACCATPTLLPVGVAPTNDVGFKPTDFAICLQERNGAVIQNRTEHLLFTEETHRYNALTAKVVAPHRLAR